MVCLCYGSTVDCVVHAQVSVVKNGRLWAHNDYCMFTGKSTHTVRCWCFWNFSSLLSMTLGSLPSAVKLRFKVKSLPGMASLPATQIEVHASKTEGVIDMQAAASGVHFTPNAPHR
jgi:hypothetical protein